MIFVFYDSYSAQGAKNFICTLHAELSQRRNATTFKYFYLPVN